MVARKKFLDQFLAEAYEVSFLAGDFSPRRYFRVQRGAESHVLMEVDPVHLDVRPFVSVTSELQARGFRVPAIVGQDLEGGRLLLEDLGDQTLNRALQEGVSPHVLYQKAVEVLGTLARVEPWTGLEAFSRPLLKAELERWLTFVSPKTTGFWQAWDEVLAPVERAFEMGQVCVALKDFHVDNLMIGPDGEVALLDYQDALLAPFPYDLVSLLEDARRRIPLEFSAAFKAYFFERLPPTVDRALCDQLYTILGAQRAFKIWGLFVCHAQTQGRTHLWAHLPNLYYYLGASLRTPLLEPVRAWMEGIQPLSEWLQEG